MMRVAIVQQASLLSGYTREMLRAWGLFCSELIDAGAIKKLRAETHPVAICPGGDLTHQQIDGLDRYVHAGGTLIAICPPVKLAEIAGVELISESRTGSLRLRVHGLVVRGLQGESLPIVGPTQWGHAPQRSTLASIFVPGQFKGEDHETPGIVSSMHGRGRVITVLFDLPRSVMMLRQGDPAHADRQLVSKCELRRNCKPTNLATDIGPDDSGQIPFADLLGRLLVDLVIDAAAAPVPLLSTFPAGATGVLLMSGDEDTAPVAMIDQQMSQTTQAGGRMNLYMIPNETQSSSDDVQRYTQTHDLGPHPNLVPWCDERPAVRVAEYEKQIKQFESMFAIKARSVRNHVAGWVGYLDLVAVQERLGIKMDGNYFSGRIFRERNQSPFTPFGGALPMRFTEPNGRLYDVFQQHTQLNDDVWFAPDCSYSYQFSPSVAEPMMRRILMQLADRFRMPLTCNFHPSNWHFASSQALTLMRIAKDHGIVCWSLDQWLSFWEARDTCQVNTMTWNGTRLFVKINRTDTRDDLCLELPMQWQDKTLQAVSSEGEPITYNTHSQYEGDLARIRLPKNMPHWIFEALYQSLEKK